MADDEDTTIELGNLKHRLVQRHGEREPKLELSMQNHNIDDYRSVLGELDLLPYVEVRNRGNRRIVKCYRHFVTKLEGVKKEDLDRLLDKLNSTMLVKIEVSSHSDAFMLFESLNNRGVPLSAIDLIKNKLLAEIEARQIESIDDAFTKWNVIVANLEDYPVQERFLRQYYNAFKIYPDVRVDGAARATRSNLIKIYETLIERDTGKIFSELLSKSKIYRKLTSPLDADDPGYDYLKKELIDLINVQAAPAYLLLLYVFSLPEKKEPNFYKNLLQLLVKYFIRRNITDFPNTRNLDQIFMNLIDLLESNPEKRSIEEITAYLTSPERCSSKELFETKLNGDLYELNVDATRFLLSKIEESKHTLENPIDFWKRDRSDKLIWTIEHIFPEGKNIPESWVNMIADGDEALAMKIQGEWVHKLGNLTLTGYNQSLSNFDFEKKRDRTDASGNFIGYKNGLFLNAGLKDRSNWNKEDIVSRNADLVRFALDIFALPTK